MKNLSISGKMYSGKDTLAEYLLSVLGERYTVVKFADPLYALCNTWNQSYELRRTAAFDFLHKLRLAGITIKDSIADKFVAKFIVAAHELAPKFPDEKPRELLQYVGTELVRNKIDKLAWVKLFTDIVKYHNNKTTPKYVICTDMRFMDEFIACKESHFITIRINITKRLSNSRCRFLGGKILSGMHEHASEVDLDGLDKNRWDVVFQASDKYLLSDHYVRELEHIIYLATKEDGVWEIPDSRKLGFHG